MTRLTTSKPNSHAHRGFYVGRSLLVLALAFALPNHNSFATDADWNEDPVSGDWDTAANWTPAVVPDGTATFGVSNITNISISRNPTSVEVIYFQTEASVYTFTVSPGSALLITRGLTNIYRYNQNLVCEGSTDIGTPGGLLEFSGESSANGFALTASGGENGGPGGVIRFQDQTTSYNSFVTLSGNATLDISALTGPYGVQIGSLTGYYSLGGAGIVNLGSNELTVGDNNRGCYFEGIIQDGPNGSGGSLRKVGNANLQLAGSNTYTGETIVEQGALVVLTNGGSGTGSGPVTVHPKVSWLVAALFRGP